MKFIFFMLMAGMTLFTQSVGAASTEFIQERIKMNAYYRDLVQAQLDNMVPKGNYTVEVDAQLDDAKLKSYFNEKEMNLNLPLGSTFAETNYSLKQDSPASISFDELSRYVVSKSVRVGLSDTVSPAVRAMIKETVQNQLRLSVEKGDKVETFDLPKEFSETWSQWIHKNNFNAETKDLMPYWFMLVGVILLCGILGVFFFFGVRSMMTRMSKDLTSLSQQMNQQPMNAVSKPVSADDKAKPAAQKSEASKAAIEKNMGDIKIFEKLDLALLKFICADCSSDEHFKYVPYALIYHWLENPTAEQLEQALNDEQKTFPASLDLIPEKAEVMQFLIQQYPHYKMLNKSSFAASIVQYTVDQMVLFVKTLAPVEAVVLVEKLSPLKKQVCISKLPLAERLAWTKISLKEINAERLAMIEASLIDQLSKFDFSSATILAARSEVFGVDPQSQQMFLSVSTFEEDEALFEATRNEPHLYRGVLNVAYEATPEHFATVDVKVVALATFGYSLKVRDMMISKIAGKRGEWYKSFTEKNIQEGLSFGNSAVEEARHAVVAGFITNHDAKKSA